MRISMKATGLGKAKHITTALAMINAAYRGVEMRGGARRGPGETGTNADVKENLALGGRDIGPNDEDGTLASKAYVAVVEAFLRMQSDKKPPTKGMAKNTAAQAWRAAGAAVNASILKRIEASKDKDGNVIEVSPGYAKTRAAKRSMANSTAIVYRDTGQLIEDFANRSGLKLIE